MVFDNFWLDVWVRFKGVWKAASGKFDGPIHLPALLATAARRAKDTVLETTGYVIGRCLAEKVEVADVKSPSVASLCKELYVALKLCGGHLVISNLNVAREAIFYGILALNPQGVRHVNLLNEPCIAAALEQAGDDLVRTSLSVDPVYQRLNAHLRSSAAFFSHIENIKGLSLEAVFVWHVLRTVILHGGSAALSDVLHGFVSEPAALHSRVTNAVVTAKRACTPTTLAFLGGGAAIAASHSCPDFAVFLQPNVDVILFGVDTDAGADVIFCAARDGSTDRDLVVVQAKSEKTSRLAECLRAATPAWQYVQEKQRHAVTTGVWTKDRKPISNVPTRKRVEFSGLVAAHLQFFEHSIRVTFTVGPFAAHTRETCRELNDDEDACGGSPVVLCSLGSTSGQVVPEQLRNSLLNSCSVDGRLNNVAHPDDDIWWISHSVQAVDSAIRETRAMRWPDDDDDE